MQTKREQCPEGTHRAANSATSPVVSTTGNVRHFIRLSSMIMKLEAQAHPPVWLKTRGSTFTRSISRWLHEL